MDETEKPKRTRGGTKRSGPKRVLETPEGWVIPVKSKTNPNGIDKFFRDVLSYWHGSTEIDNDLVTVYDPNNPIGPDTLRPSPTSPVCAKCNLFEDGCEHPFFDYVGPDKPLITVIYDGISPREDQHGELAIYGAGGSVRRVLEELSKEIGFSMDEIRWVPMTRCAARNTRADLKVKGNWCRLHVIEDLLYHPPKVVLPVGTAVLGLLCHKSNAQDWQGKVLTYRGWPDDWLTKREWTEPRPHPANPDETVYGHPVFGPPPDVRIPMVPVQSPRLVFAAQNPIVTGRWREAIKLAVTMAHTGVKAKTYTKPWYRFVNDVDAVKAGLAEILAHPGIPLAYDTETTGLKPLNETAAIVSMMFRWVDPQDNKPRSLGFPWQFNSIHYDNRIVEHIPELAPLVLQVLSQSRVICHNATFDLLYTYFTVKHPDLDALEPDSREYNLRKDEILCGLADAFEWDTWHMAYTFKQERGTLGLEMLAYLYVKDMAGYEEEMTLLIERFENQLFPGAKEPAPGDTPHYLNIGEEFYPDYVIPYVMGDVETCYMARDALQKKLEHTREYHIPIAKPSKLGSFREFTPPTRDWVYEKIMSPASRTLMKVMGRGMHVDAAVLQEMEQLYPAQVREHREKLKNVDEQIVDWCEAEKAQNPEWEMDLENKAHLKHVLFSILKLPIQRLTKTGRKLFGETQADWDAARAQGVMTDADLDKFAALDKFTLNKLAVDHESVRPLQAYRQVFKLYSTYIRPLRNIFTEGIDKKQRTNDPHLCSDGCIHASFMLTGTRGGRLSCRDPNLQQLPNKGDVKRMFVSRFGQRGCMYQADLSQIELRLLAAACGDPTMIQAYLDKVDLHTLTTSRIFNKPYDNWTKDHMKWLQENGREKEAKELDLERRIGKTVNFLTGYGGGAFGLQTILANNQVYLPIERCEEIIERFFDSYPSLQQMLKYYKWFIEDNKVAVSIFGRVRVFEEVAGDDREAASKALRAGCNHLIQSTASDMMLIALIVIETMMREQGLESILVSTVHDSLLIDCVKDEIEEVHSIVSPVLNNFDQVLPAYLGDDYDTSWMLVPFAGDCEVGPSYYDTRKIPEKDIDWDKLLATE